MMARPNKELRKSVQDAPMERDAFYDGYELEELARIQGVKPVEDFNSLLGGWPDDIDDGFEEAVQRWRGHKPESKE